MATGTRSIGFFGRLKTGWTLTKDSIGVIRDHPKLMVFPALAGASSVVFFLFFLLPMLLADVIGGGLLYVVLFALYFLTTFASTYFSAGLVHASNEAFHGREPSVRDSLGAINDRLGPIVAWSLIAATVSIVLRSLENSDNPVASILRSLFALAWSVMTFFVVPVIVFEDVTVTEMFKRSGETFKETWGENLGAGFGITAITFLIGLALVAVAVVVSFTVATAFPGPAALLFLVLAAMAVTFTYLLSQTIWGVAKTALYVYATEGEYPEEFSNFDFQTLGGRAERTASPGRTGRGPGSPVDD